MFIEHESDRNMTGTGRKDPTVSDMIDLQQALVADHIAELEREGAALRAERAQAAQEHDTASGPASPVRLPVAVPSRRVRIGRWLVGVGSAIAGTTEPVPAALVADDGPCDDGPTTIPHAA